MTGLTDFPRHSPALAQQFRDRGFWNDDRLADYLERWADETPDKVAIAAPDRDIAFAEWRARSRRFANALLGLGLRRGDVVAIQYPNRPEFPIAFLGVAMMGGVLCTLHMPYRAGEMAPLMNHGRARAVICTAANGPLRCARDDGRPEGAGAVARAYYRRRRRRVRWPRSQAGSIFDALIDGADDRPIADPPAAADPVILCFTSGTSASPKGVVRTHEDLHVEPAHLPADHRADRRRPDIGRAALHPRLRPVLRHARPVLRRDQRPDVAVLAGALCRPADPRPADGSVLRPGPCRGDDQGRIARRCRSRLDPGRYRRRVGLPGPRLPPRWSAACRMAGPGSCSA